MNKTLRKKFYEHKLNDFIDDPRILWQYLKEIIFNKKETTEKTSVIVEILLQFNPSLLMSINILNLQPKIILLIIVLEILNYLEPT